MSRKKSWRRSQDAIRHFLNAGKTERECAAEAIRLARAAGYQSLEEVQQTGKKLEAGDKVYACGMKKMLVLFQIWQEAAGGWHADPRCSY